MSQKIQVLSIAVLLLGGCVSNEIIDPGPRPAYLVAGLQTGPLKTTLEACANGPFYRTDFSISHRGAPLGYPEHTREGYIAAAEMGAGLIECDVTFTRDHQLVCRHAQCDLHTTTNILKTPLAERCVVPFTPANADQPAAAKCCTSALDLNEFRTLCGRRDIVDRTAASVDGYLVAPDSPWTNEPVSCGTLMTHSESVALFDDLGVKFVPELKSPMVEMPHNGLTQSAYATAMIDEYRARGIDPRRVFPQSFNINDIHYWIANHPEFGENAVYLDPRGRNPEFKPTLENMQALKAAGINIIAPPMPMLLKLDESGDIQPSDYARYAREAGLHIITWTIEAGDPTDPANWMYASIPGYMQNEAQILEVLDVLSRKVGIRGIFSDWPGTVTYYASCLSETEG